MNRTEIASHYFSNTFNCSQSVVTAFGKDINLSEDLCLKIGCAFGGGMARNQKTCGAVTGALIVIGLVIGRGARDPYSHTENAYAKVNDLFQAFILRNGSINCKELLLGLDMNDEEDKKKIQKAGLFKTSCLKYVRDAVEITEGMIIKNEK
jgi:C_GCAxxG_C_C family probable redox protein